MASDCTSCVCLAAAHPWTTKVHFFCFQFTYKLSYLIHLSIKIQTSIILYLQQINITLKKVTCTFVLPTERKSKEKVCGHFPFNILLLLVFRLILWKPTSQEGSVRMMSTKQTLHSKLQKTGGRATYNDFFYTNA